MIGDAAKAGVKLAHRMTYQQHTGRCELLYLTERALDHIGEMSYLFGLQLVAS